MEESYIRDRQTGRQTDKNKRSQAKLTELLNCRFHRIIYILNPNLLKDQLKNNKIIYI